MVPLQFVLLTVAWIHGCIGLYFWLRLRPFFRWAAPFLLAVAVLLPPLAMLGVYRGANDVALASQPEWRGAHVIPIPPAQRSMLDDIALRYIPIGYIGLIGMVFVARGVRRSRERSRGMFTVTYPDRQVRVPKGMSVPLRPAYGLRCRMPASAADGRGARPVAFASSVITAGCRAPPDAKHLY